MEVSVKWCWKELGDVLGDLGGGPRTCGFALDRVLPGNGGNGDTWPFLSSVFASLFRHDYRAVLLS